MSQPCSTPSPHAGPAALALPQWSQALGHAPSDKRLEVLRRIAAGGSISQAARDAGISYKAAWQAIDTLSNLAGVELVRRAVGGAGGGGALVTPAGAQLLQLADALAQARQQVLERLAGAGPAAVGTTGRGHEGERPAPSLGLRTSMRNQWPATVRALRRQGAVVQIQLALAGGDALRAALTRESVELLGLRPGVPVLALCKATAVRVWAAGSEAPPDAVAGRVVRTAQAGAGQELTLSSPGGLQWVGLSAPGVRLRRGARALAWVDAAAVVLAAAD